MNVKVKNTNTAVSTSFANKAFKKGLKQTREILFGENKKTWRQTLADLEELIAGAGGVKARGISRVLLGSSFGIIQFRDERDQQRLVKALPALDTSAITESLHLHFLEELWEADLASKLRVIDQAETCQVITANQAVMLRERYQKRASMAAGRKAVGDAVYGTVREYAKKRTPKHLADQVLQEMQGAARNRIELAIRDNGLTYEAAGRALRGLMQAKDGKVAKLATDLQRFF